MTIARAAMSSRMGVRRSLAAVFGAALVAFAPAPAAEAAPTAFAAGSYVIPMDEAYQDYGMWKAYGLVYRLIGQGIPVHWAIAQGKAYNGADFSVATAINRQTLVAVAPLPYVYRGAPFVIAAADTAAAQPIITAWWAANGNRPTVHQATAGFTADIDIVLSRAPHIANDSQGAPLSGAYFDAAGIPDDDGDSWNPSSPNVLDQNEIAAGALLDVTGTCSRRKYDVFVTPHNKGFNYSLSDPGNSGTIAYSQLDKFVYYGGGWVGMCQSIVGIENAIVDLYQNGNAAVRALFPSSQNTGYLTQNGFGAIANQGGTWTVDDPGAPSLPIAQSLSTSNATQSIPTGSVSSWRHTTVTYVPGVERVAYFKQGTTENDHVVNGVYHGGDGRGKVSFLGGHSYSTTLPYSRNSDGPYLRAFYNALFFNGAAVARLELRTAPPWIYAGVSTTIEVQLTNTGASVAQGISNVVVTLQAALSYLGMASGPLPDSVAPGAGGTTVLTWSSLPDLAGGATALGVNAQALYMTPGVYGYPTLRANYGDTFDETFLTDDCSSLLVLPAPIPQVSKTPASQGPFASGKAVGWTLSYTNAGSANLLSGVVEDILPAGFAFVTSTPAPTSVVPLADGTTRLRFTVGTLAPGAGGTITLTALAPRITVPLQQFTNSVSFAGVNAAGVRFASPVSTATVSIAAPVLDLNKTVSPATPRLPGDTLTYTITPSYQETLALSGAVITDPIPANTTYVNGSANAGGTQSGGIVTWNLGSNSPAAAGVTAPPGFGYCPATVTLASAADTYLDKNNAAANFGAAATITTRPFNNNFLRNALVRFDLSGIPAGAVLYGARMVLNVTNARAGNHFDKVFQMVTDWTEAGASWNLADGASAWAGGGAFSGADYSGSALGTFSPIVTGPASVDITDAVAAWRAGAPNRGVVLLSTGTDNGTAQYGSRENGTAANQPQLVVSYLVLTPDQGGGVACSGTPALTSAGDTWIDKNNVNANNGNTATLITNPGVNDTSANTRHSLVQFDFSGIPPGATINSATLTLTVTTARNNHVDLVRRVVTPWVERAATWNTRDGTTAWAGGSFAGADYAATNYGSVTATPLGVKTVNVTALVNDWVNNGFPNRGLVLVSTGTDNVNAAYGSRENGVAANRPRLDVSWTLPVSSGASTMVELSSHPLLVTGSGQVTVTMTVTATAGTVTGVTPPATLNAIANGATATLASGPTPAGPVALDAAGTASASFTYVYDVTAGANPGSVGFAGKPTGSAAFFAGSSNSTIVTPPFTFQVTIDSPLASTITQLQNIASLTDDNFFTDPVVATALTTIRQPLLTLAKIGSPEGPVGPNDVITYALTLKNEGTGPAAGVSVTDVVPANTTYVAGSCAPAVCGMAGGNVTWTVGALPDGATAVLTFQARASTTLPVGTYTISNTASVTATGVAAVASNTVSTTLEVVPVLGIDKVQISTSPDDAIGLVSPGDTISYTLLIDNVGFPTAGNIVVTDTIPVGTTYVPGSAGTGVYDPGTRTITWPAFSLAGGATTSRLFQVTVDTPALNGASVTNVAFATATALPEPAASNQVSYTISAAPALTVTKSALPASATTVVPGQTITYTLVVEDSGNANTSDAFLNDLIPPGSAYVPNSTTINGAPAPELTPGVPPVENLAVFSPGMGDPDGDGGVLAVGSPATVTFEVTVVDPIPNGYVILNNALAAVGSFAGCPSPLCAISNDTNHPVFSETDLGVTKTVDDPNPYVDVTTQVTFTITVSNLGAHAATGVNVSETLPAGMTLVSATPSVGSFDSGTGVWTIAGNWSAAAPPDPAALPVAGSATLTIVANIDSTYVYTEMTNTVSIAGSEQTDAAAANNSASAVVFPLLTRASLRGLRVDPAGLVEFATGTQSGTLSFDVYAVERRGAKAEWTKLNDGPIATPRPDSLTPIVYSVTTPAITAPYVAIVEKDVKGREQRLGPYTVGDPGLLAEFEAVERRLEGSASVSGKVPGRGQGKARLARALRSQRRAQKRAEKARFASGLEGVKLETRGQGPLCVPRAVLEPAGLPGNVKLKKVDLSRQGLPVPFSVDGAGASESLCFRAESLRTSYTDTNVYVVGWGKAKAPTGVPLSLPEAPAPLGFTRIQKSTTYVTLAPAGVDPWFWDFLWGDGSSWPYPDWMTPGIDQFELPGLPAGSGPVAVRIGLWGYTGSKSHRVAAWINDMPAGEIEFAGNTAAVLEGSVPLAVLRASGNKLKLAYTSSDGWEGYLYLRFLDLGVRLADVPGTATLERVDGYDTTLPARLSSNDTLIVTHPAFAEQAARLAKLKRGEGKKAEVVDVYRAYDRYTGGVVEANAIHALIRAAGAAGKLRQVLLFGDDSLDPNDYLGLDSVSYVPSLFAWDGEMGWVPSENRYADLDGDAVPEIAIGRLPANDAEQARLLVDKIEHQVETLQASEGRQLFVVDDSTRPGEAFEPDARGIAASLPEGTLQAWARVADGWVYDAATRRWKLRATETLKQALAEGAAATHYFGHGSTEQWAEPIVLDSALAASLDGPPSVVFTWACQAGYYLNLWGPSVNEALLLNRTGGALATFAPSGITSTTAQRPLAAALYDELRDGNLTLGEAIRRAKLRVLAEHPSARPAVEGFNLLGDPSLPAALLGFAR